MEILFLARSSVDSPSRPWREPALATAISDNPEVDGGPEERYYD